jgi:5-methyltetrahydrofolate--homocysteine methyltransferase
VNIQDLIASGKPVIADGGMGTMLFSLGLQRGDSPELWNVNEPEKVASIHAGYADAGAKIILTNTFGGNRFRLDQHGDRAVELNEAGAVLARKAIGERPIVIGGSMGPTGQFIEPLGTMTFEQAVAVFAEQARGLLAGGVDVFWIETMSDLEELRAAFEGARQVSADTPIVTTMTFDTKGRTMMGVKPEQAVKSLKKMGAVALGANCGNGPQEIEDVIGKMREADPDAVLVAKSNAGLPKMVNGETVYDATPDVMGAYAVRVRDLGANIIGACCGSTPDHIKAIANAL